MAEHGVYKSGEQCRTKVKKLCQEHKDNNKGTGNGRIEWKYFNKLEEILAARPATCASTCFARNTEAYRLY